MNSRNYYEIKDPATDTVIQVPRVSHISRTLVEPAAVDRLMYWAAREAAYTGDADAWSKIRTEAGDIGTHAHLLIEAACIKGVTIDIPPVPESISHRAAAAAHNFGQYARAVKLRLSDVHAVEIELVSEEHHYGGTVDMIANVPSHGDPNVTGGLWVFDWKTSTQVGHSAFLQCAAYVMVAIERGYPINGARVVRLGKKVDDAGDPILDYQEWVMGLDTVACYFGQFKHLLDIYHESKKLKKPRSKTHKTLPSRKLSKATSQPSNQEGHTQ